MSGVVSKLVGICPGGAVFRGGANVLACRFSETSYRVVSQSYAVFVCAGHAGRIDEDYRRRQRSRWSSRQMRCSPVFNPLCLGGAAVRRRTRDRKVAGSTPDRGAIKSTRSTQPSIPPG